MEVIDSCATSNGGCDHVCRHGVGGPVCACHRGYQLQADGRSCEGIFTGVINESYFCVIFYGSTFNLGTISI